MTIADTSARAYALDTGVIIAFQRADQLEVLGRAAEKVVLVVVEEVKDELLDVPSKHAHRANEVREVLLVPGRVRVEHIAATEPAAEVLRHLRRNRTSSTDLGETASIAWARFQDETHLVIRDAAVAFLALEELRGRVLGIFGFLMELVDRGVVDVSDAREVATAITKASGVSVQLPTWWPK